MQEFALNKEFITLGQLLKEVGVISTGGQAKYFLQENEVFLMENRKTVAERKLESMMK